jgi:adenine phosphoribosyltransferase
MLRAIYENAHVVWSGKFHTTVNEFADQLPALRPAVLKDIAERVIELAKLPATKVLAEEEKGAVLATAVSLKTGIPLAMARMYPYSLPSPRVPLVSEYLSGNLHVNGVEPSDEVLVVEDTISTGGTLIALLRAIELIGAKVKDVIAVVEKIDNKGVERVRKETGIEVKTMMKIRVQDGRVIVL